MTGKQPEAGEPAAKTATKQAVLHSLAERRYTLGLTAKGEPYVSADDVTYLLAPRRLGPLRGDLIRAWRADDACEGDPPGDGLLNREIAAMECDARGKARDEPALREAADSLIAETCSPVDDHPERLKVHAGARNPVDIADDVAEYLQKRNEPPELFSMGPAVVLLKDNGALVPLDGDGWLAYVARRVDFIVTTKDVPRIVTPPGPALKILPSILVPELPPLDGIVTSPYLDAGANVVDTDGYHPGTRLVLHSGGLRLPAVSETPSQEAVDAAVELLVKDWLGDFPFASDADRVSAVAALLTLTGRQFFSLAPLFVMDASTPGSGKGLLVTTLSLIGAGEVPHFMELPADGEEQRKKITSALLAGHALIAWDESHVIAGRTLAMILTAGNYSDRLLGGNKMITVTNRFTQVALGNNVQVWGDMKRRVVPCRLVPDVEHPEHRTGWRHPDLEQWVRRNRGSLLGAALTIWRNWDAKGRPEADVSMGSFERWAKAVGGALEAAGIRGFLSHTEGWLDNSDEDAPEWQAHLAALRTRFGGEHFTALGVAIEAGKGADLSLPWFRRDPDMPMGKALGYKYRNIRDRWLGNYRLTQHGVSHGRTRWLVSIREDVAE